MVRPHYGLTAPEQHVARTATRYAPASMNYRLLKRLWLTPNHHHGIEDLAKGLNVAAVDVRRALDTLARDGFVCERRDGAQTVYVVASSLSAHWLISQLLTTHLETPAEQPPRR
jgi:Mn-dependent DtxR family transcriptional regulator